MRFLINGRGKEYRNPKYVGEVGIVSNIGKDSVALIFDDGKEVPFSKKEVDMIEEG